MCLRPSQRGTHALAKLPRDLRLRCPYGHQDIQNVAAPDHVYRQATQSFEGVALQLLHPGLLDLGAAPARAVRLEGPFRGFPEGRHVDPALCGQRVAATPGKLPVLECLVPGFGQADERIAAQTDVAPLAVDGDSLDPGLRSTRRDIEIEGAAVPIQACIRQRFDFGGGESSHVFPTTIP